MRFWSRKSIVIDPKKIQFRIRFAFSSKAISQPEFFIFFYILTLLGSNPQNNHFMPSGRNTNIIYSKILPTSETTTFVLLGASEYFSMRNDFMLCKEKYATEFSFLLLDFKWFSPGNSDYPCCRCTKVLNGARWPRSTS